MAPGEPAPVPEERRGGDTRGGLRRCHPQSRHGCGFQAVPVVDSAQRGLEPPAALPGFGSARLLPPPARPPSEAGGEKPSRLGNSRRGSEPLGNTPPPFPKNTSPKGVCSSSPNPGGDPQGGDPRVSAPLLRPPCPAPGEQTASPTRGNPPALQGWRRGASLRRTVGTAASPTAICAPYFCQAPFGKEVFHPDTWLWGQEDGFGLRSFACERWIGRDVTADEWQ